MLRFAMISKWHVHAQSYAQIVRAQPDACIRCVWDEAPERGREWAKELGVDFEADYDAVLARPDVDAVLIDTPTNMHKEVMIKAARAGKHIFTEKVFALTVKDCDEIIDEIKRAGVTFTICFPHRCMPRNLFVHQAVTDGMLGDITLLRIRNAHDGATAGWLPDYWYDPVTTGGGAMMDLGVHGMYLANYLLGRPVRIQSMFTRMTGRAVDDNAVCMMEFENHAVAITETALVSPLTPFMLEVYGTKGVIQVKDYDIKFRTAGQKEWRSPELLPDALPHPIRQFIDSVLYKKDVRFGMEEGRMLTLMMEKAYESDATRREITF